jgi:hypothetical protein
MTKPERTPRSTAMRTRMRERIAKTRADCHLCGQPISYDLPHTDPRSFVVDHVVSLKAGGADALTNAKAAHRRQTGMQCEEGCATSRRQRATIFDPRMTEEGWEGTPSTAVVKTSGHWRHPSPAFFHVRMTLNENRCHGV